MIPYPAFSESTRGELAGLLTESHLPLGERSLSPFRWRSGPSTKLLACFRRLLVPGALLVGQDDCRCRLGRYRDRVEIIRSTAPACRACSQYRLACTVGRRRGRPCSSLQRHMQPLCSLPPDLEVHPRGSSPRPPRRRVGRQCRHLDRRRYRLRDERGEARRVEPVRRRLDARSPPCTR